MISAWRDAFQIPTLPFTYVLLAGGHTAVMREAQMRGAGGLPHTAFATAMDLGAYGDEYLVPGHPPRKQEVGRRLSLLLRSMVYGGVGGAGSGGGSGSGGDHASGDDDDDDNKRVTAKRYVGAGGGAIARGPRVIASQVKVTQHAPPPPSVVEVLDSSTADASSSVSVVVLVATIPFSLDHDVAGTLHLNATGSCSSPTKDIDACCNVNGSAPSWVVSFARSSSDNHAVAATQLVVDAASGTVTASAPFDFSSSDDNSTVEVRVLFDNNPTCALYSGALAGPDAIYAAHPHFGLVAEMWRAVVVVD